MSQLAPKFNDWAFSTAGFVVTSAEIDPQYATRGEKSVIADMGIVPEGTLGSMQIKLSGTIATSTNQAARDAWSLLLANLRGSDRIKKGRLDLYGDSHYYCQLVSVTPLRHLSGEGNISVSLTFEADEPYRRLNTITTYSEIVSVSDPVMNLAFASTILGNAPRIPCIIKPPTLAFAKNDVIRVFNSTVGWRFEHVVTQALTTSDQIIIDGETGEVSEKGVVVGDGNAGTAPYLKGGVSNQITFSGTTLSRLVGTWSVQFWDRYLG